MITLHPLKLLDARELLEFEKKNRAHFETWVPGRGDAYYEPDVFQEIMEELISEQEAGQVYMYLIRNEKQQVVGRVNLTAVVRGMFQKAELGFRIGEFYGGKGYAAEAVKLVLEEATQQLGLHRIEAGTSPDNILSQRVLEKNGFRLIGMARKFIHYNGQWHDSLLYERILDE